QLRCAPDAHLDAIAQLRAGEVATGDLGVMQVELERDEPSTRRKRARHPDRAVRAERADLEDPSRTARAGEQVEQLPLRRRDGDRWQLLGDVRLQRRAQYVVRGEEVRGEELVDVRPDLFRHAVVSDGWVISAADDGADDRTSTCRA